MIDVSNKEDEAYSTVMLCGIMDALKYAIAAFEKVRLKSHYSGKDYRTVATWVDAGSAQVDYNSMIFTVAKSKFDLCLPDTGRVNYEGFKSCLEEHFMDDSHVISYCVDIEAILHITKNRDEYRSYIRDAIDATIKMAENAREICTMMIQASR